MSGRIITAEQKLKCVERELKLRRQVYPNRIETSRMTKEKADYEIMMMEAIVADYKALAEKDRLI